MTKFTFIAEEDDVKSSIEFETDVWLDAFPKFLNLMRASEFYISDGTALYVPKISERMFNNGDRDFLLFDSDLADNTIEKCCGKCSTPKESNDHSSW